MCAFEKHKQSEKYSKAVEKAKAKGENHVRLSHRLKQARHDHEKGKHISEVVLDGSVNFRDLSHRDKVSTEDFEVGRTTKAIDALVKEQKESGSTKFHLLRMDPSPWNAKRPAFDIDDSSAE